jgi:hypothetical protein
MTATLSIESFLAVPAADIVAALSAGGIEGTVIETDPYLSMAIPADDEAKLAARVGHALESLIAERRLSLIPEWIGGSAFVMRPPCA